MNHARQQEERGERVRRREKKVSSSFHSGNIMGEQKDRGREGIERDT